MSSIVKPNASLAAGNLAVIRRSYSTTDDGSVTYEVDYCSLAIYANTHIGKFRSGALPPTPIPSSMSQLRIDGTPKLYDLTTNTQNGLTYFNARYSAASLDVGETITTESTEQRNFSAVVTGSIRTPVSGFGGSSIVEGDVNLSFDYISTTVQVEAKNPRALPLVKGSVGRPFNVSVSDLQGETPIVLGTYRASQIETTSKTRSSRGTFTYTKASSGIYEVTQKLI